jgi:hypothetical protein
VDLLAAIEKVARDNIRDFMIFTTLLVGFAGFLRYSDICRVCLEVSTFASEHVALFLEFSKTDQFRDGAIVYIARRRGSALCPYATLREVCDTGGITTGTWLRRAQHTSNGWSLKAETLGYSSFIDNMRGLLRRAGLEADLADEFGARCMRAGGATRAEEVGVPARLRCAHGRWKSLPVADGYIGDALEQRLRVSSSLGL